MKTLLKSTLISLMTLSSTYLHAGLDVGSEATAFAANDDTGEIWNASQYLGEKNIIVYFYPAAMTGGCTKQACAYRDNSKELAAADAVVIGVSGDSVNNLALFKEAHDLNFPLLSDPNGSLAELFGVPMRKGGSIEREVGGSLHTLVRNLTTARWTFVIGKDGKVIYKNDEVKATEDTSTVLSLLKG